MIDRILDGAALMVHWLADRITLPVAVTVAVVSTVAVAVAFDPWSAIISAAIGITIALVLVETGR